MDNDFGLGDNKNVTEPVTEGTKGFGASYTLGSASVRALVSETDNVGGVRDTDVEHMEVSLMLAF